MRYLFRRVALLLTFILAVNSLTACYVTINPPPATSAPQVVQVTKVITIPVTQVVEAPKVTYLGQDGSKLIGSNCPGTDYRGVVVQYLRQR